ncbi:nucleotidyltransferase family protein [Ningiella sp. W23]|uniref:nucleotidyltransferase family protein n=1 Tax=Ningiella sp. W23 TaxID=3023715 RepID=UPI003756BE30
MPAKPLTSNAYQIELAILAAGSSQRFGGIKQLHKYGDMTLLQRVCEQLNQSKSQFMHFRVMLGANAERVSASLNECYDCRHVVHWQRGMSESIKQAVHCVSEKTTHLMVCLGDQIAISSDDIDALVQASRAWPQRLVCAQFKSDCQNKVTTVNGVPAIFPRAYFKDLLALQGDKGARALLASSSHAAPSDTPICVNMPNAAVDIDTQSDLEALSRSGFKR